MIFTVLALCVCASISAKTLPPEIKKCSISDPNISKCLEEVVPDAVLKLSPGNKELGIVPLEPLLIQKIDLGNSNSGSVSIHQIYENMKLYGIANGVIYDNEAKFSDGECFWRFKGKSEKVTMLSDYKMTGQLLLFPINGHGKCNNTLFNIVGEYDTKCEKYMKKNKTYLRVTDFSLKIKPERVIFDFENLIDGNEQLSKEVVKTLNENALVVYADVGYAFDHALSQVWKETINRVFSRVPENELFLP